MSRLPSGARALIAFAMTCGAACTFDVPNPYAPSTGGAGGAGSTTTAASSSSGEACQAGEATCPGEIGCFAISNDDAHCGTDCKSCGKDGKCIAGECTCPVETSFCNNPPGCYATANDDAHCGGCQACATGESCLNSHCDCAIGKVHCTGLAGCFSLDDDKDHCGDCAFACEAYETCSGGHCGCPSGEIECAANAVSPAGCYGDTSSNPAHCGAACAACDPTEECAGGVCQCPSATHACMGPNPPGGCFPDDDAAHCGATCTQCPTGQTCSGGACVCPMGTTQCGAECVADLSTDPMHCGACDRACSVPRFPGAGCVASHCEPAEAANAPPYVGTVAIDPTDDTRLYFAGAGSGPTSIDRFLLGDTSAAEVGPPVDFVNVTLAARAGSVAFTLEGTDSPLYAGPFGGTVAPLVPNVTFGATFIQYVGSELYWGENSTNGCIFRESDTTGFACGADREARSMYVFGSTAYLLTPGSGGFVDSFSLPESARTPVDVWGPSTWGASASPAIAVGPDEAVFYFSVSPQPTKLRRYPHGGQWFDDVEWRTFTAPGFTVPLALFMVGDTVYWATQNGATVTVERALASADPATLAPELVTSFDLPSGASTRSWIAGPGALYYVRQNNSPFESKLFRVAE